MITEAEFTAIEREVFAAIKECFSVATANQARLGEIMVFFARGNYNPAVSNEFNPHTIDQKEEFYKELDTQSFLLNIIKDKHNFTKSMSRREHSERTIIELMTYTHIWESVPYLKMLRRLACMCNSMDYPWEVKIPPTGKHNFVRTEIRDLFKLKTLKIYDVIKKGFQSQLRDAFAHSDFSLQWHPGYIWLYNYDPSKAHLVQEISLDEWTKRFCYTWQLNYQLNECFFDVRQNSHILNGSNDFMIPVPIGNSRFRNVEIVYSPPPHDMFQYKANT